MVSWRFWNVRDNSWPALSQLLYQICDAHNRVIFLRNRISWHTRRRKDNSCRGRLIRRKARICIERSGNIFASAMSAWITWGANYAIPCTFTSYTFSISTVARTALRLWHKESNYRPLAYCVLVTGGQDKVRKKASKSLITCFIIFNASGRRRILRFVSGTF